MDIYGITELILSSITFDGAAVFFCFGMPEIAPNAPRFIVYDVTENVALWADSKIIGIQNNVTINVFCDKTELSQLRETVLSAFSDSGFLYRGGGTLNTDKTYPFRTQSYQEFTIKQRRY